MPLPPGNYFGLERVELFSREKIEGFPGPSSAIATTSRSKPVGLILND